MATWTTQAVTELSGYLRHVEGLARVAGDDAEEISSGLREHIMRETEEDAGEIVTPEHLRKVLAAMGTPEEVIGADQSSRPQEHGSGTPASQPAPSPSLATEPAPAPAAKARSYSGCWLALVTGVVGLILLAVATPIVLIIISIAVPSFVKSRAIADEQVHARTSLRTIAAAEEAFQSAGYVDRNGDGVGDYGQPDQLMDQSDGSDPPYESPMFFPGYRFTINVTYGSSDTLPGYTCTAVPSRSGNRHFYLDETGVIRFTDDGTPAGPSSSPLDEAPL